MRIRVWRSSGTGNSLDAYFLMHFFLAPIFSKNLFFNNIWCFWLFLRSSGEKTIIGTRIAYREILGIEITIGNRGAEKNDPFPK
jgi:hypothetical protein